jgi:hypothetical protein
MKQRDHGRRAYSLRKRRNSGGEDVTSAVGEEPIRGAK